MHLKSLVVAISFALNLAVSGEDVLLCSVIR